MNIWQYLSRRVRIHFFIAVSAWLMVAIVATTQGESKDSPPLLLFVPLIVFAGAVLSLVFFLRCPRCKGRLGHFSQHLFSKKAFFSHINYCPFCGVSLDEPYQP